MFSVGELPVNMEMVGLVDGSCSDIATRNTRFLLTPDTLQYMGLQTFPVTEFPYGFAGQPIFT